MGNKGQSVWRGVAPTGLSMGVAVVATWVLMWAGSAQADSAPTAPPAVTTEAPASADDTARDADPWPGEVSDSGWLAMLLVSGVVAATLLDKQRH
ncbi:MAG: hypothetical protein V4739_08410 [Pseudomonadota bacterium]